LKLNGTHHFLVCADDNKCILGGSVHTIKENTEALIVASKESGENADNTKYMVMSRDQNAGRSHSIKIDNTSFEMVEEFKYLGTTLTDRSSIPQEIKSRLKSGSGCYHLVQNLLSSSLVSRNLKIKIYRTIILPIVFYGCETWSLTLREECRLRVFENRVLARIFGPKRDEVTEEWRKPHNEAFNDLYSAPHIVWVIKSRKMRLAGHVALTGESRGVCMVLAEKPEGKRPLGRPRHKWEDNIKINYQVEGCESMDWIDLAQDRDRWWALVNAIMNLRVP